MAIRIDPALHAIPQRLMREIEHEIASPSGGHFSAAVLPLNSTLLARQARIDTLTRQVKQADERGDEAMRRAHEAEAAIAAAVPAMREYARANPKHYHGDALQDPCGVHAWLEQNDR